MLQNIDSEYPTSEGPVFGAGDYWQAWSAAMRDRMDGVESYGVADRRLANKDAAIDDYQEMLASESEALIICWEAETSVCNEQADSFGMEEFEIISVESR